MKENNGLYVIAPLIGGLLALGFNHNWCLLPVVGHFFFGFLIVMTANALMSIFTKGGKK